jgi:hypothetical protein
VYAYEPVAAVLRSAEGEALGGVTLAPSGRLRLRRRVSLPFTDICPPLVDARVSERELGAAVSSFDASTASRRKRSGRRSKDSRGESMCGECAPEEPVAYATVGKAKAGSGAAARLLRSLIRVSPSWLSRWVGARSTGSRLDRHPVFPCPNGELPNGTS